MNLALTVFLILMFVLYFMIIYLEYFRQPAERHDFEPARQKIIGENRAPIEDGFDEDLSERYDSASNLK